MATPAYDANLDDLVIHDHAEKLSLSGGTMTGDLIFPVTGFVMIDADGFYWRITINTDGALVATRLGEPGTPIGLLLALTQAS